MLNTLSLRWLLLQKTSCASNVSLSLLVSWLPSLGMIDVVVVDFTRLTIYIPLAISMMHCCTNTITIPSIDKSVKRQIDIEIKSSTVYSHFVCNWIGARTDRLGASDIAHMYWNDCAMLSGSRPIVNCLGHIYSPILHIRSYCLPIVLFHMLDAIINYCDW